MASGSIDLAVNGVERSVPLSQRVTYKAPNPKVRGTLAYKRYQGYMGARTLQEAIDNGATSGDLRFDLQRCHLRLLGLRPQALGAGSRGSLLTVQGALRVPGVSGGSCSDAVVEHVLSLGSRCLVSRVLRDLELRRYTGPFDWVYSSIDMVQQCLQDKFAAFLEPTNMVPSGKSWGHKVFGPMLGRGVVFPHHQPKTEDRVLFQRAAKRFQEVVRSADRKLLVLGVPVSARSELTAARAGGGGGGRGVTAQAEQVFEKLKRYGARNFELLAVHIVAPAASDCSGRRPGVLPGRVSGNGRERVVSLELHCAGDQTGLYFKEDADEQAFRALLQGHGQRRRRFQPKPDPLPPRGAGVSARKRAYGE